MKPRKIIKSHESNNGDERMVAKPVKKLLYDSEYIQIVVPKPTIKVTISESELNTLKENILTSKQIGKGWRLITIGCSVLIAFYFSSNEISGKLHLIPLFIACCLISIGIAMNWAWSQNKDASIKIIEQIEKQFDVIKDSS